MSFKNEEMTPLESRPIIRSLLRDIVLNATIPVVCYYASKTWISPSELIALVMASVFPTIESIHGAVRRSGMNPVSVVVLLGIVTSILALFAGGDPRLLLVRESFFTGAFGIFCLFSLLLPRPVMFYFGRYFMAGDDPEKRQVFDAAWNNSIVRRGHRLITTVWAFVLIAEFVTRVILVYTLPAPVVLAVSPFVLGLATILTIGWTFRYASRLRQQATAKISNTH